MRASPRLELLRQSRTRTLCPALRIWRTQWDPTYPAPPVTSIQCSMSGTPHHKTVSRLSPITSSPAIQHIPNQCDSSPQHYISFLLIHKSDTYSAFHDFGHWLSKTIPMVFWSLDISNMKRLVGLWAASLTAMDTSPGAGRYRHVLERSNQVNIEGVRHLVMSVLGFSFTCTNWRWTSWIFGHGTFLLTTEPGWEMVTNIVFSISGVVICKEMWEFVMILRLLSFLRRKSIKL